MFNVLNDEDTRIRKFIEQFDFQRYGVPSGNIDLNLKDALVDGLLVSIGRCGKCSYFNDKTFFCNALKIHTEIDARCSDFDPNDEAETKSAFDVMSEGLEVFSKEEKHEGQGEK